MLGQLSQRHLRFRFPIILGLVAVLGVLVVVVVLFMEGNGSNGKSSNVSAKRLLTIGEQVFQFQSQYGYYTVCGVDGNLSSCPYTERLSTRLTQAKATLCRCQNPSQTLALSADVSGSGGLIYATLFDGRTTFVLKVVEENGRLLVDDETCQGGATSTSIYETIAPC